MAGCGAAGLAIFFNFGRVEGGIQAGRAACRVGKLLQPFTGFTVFLADRNMRRKILLVYPSIPTTYWSYKYALPFVRRKAVMPPLGLLTVAALLPPEFELRLVDTNVAPLSAQDVDWADLVFVSAMIVQKRSFEEVVHLCRERGRTVVAGGPYPSSSHELIRGVDHFVLDEAELTLPPFLRDLELGCPRRVYRNPEKPDLVGTPIPRFDLVDTSLYETMPVQYSRGCPFECEFCDIIEMFGRKPRTKTPEQLLREVEAVYDTGFRGSLFVVDDNFVGNKLRVRELLRELVAWQRKHGYPFSLSTEASITLAHDEELLALMAAAGFAMVFVGIETPDVQALARTRKTQNLREDILASVARIQEHGLEVTGGFIVGFDGESDDIFDRQRRFIQSAGIPTAMVGLLMALPNTRLARRLAAEGRLLEDCQGNNTHHLRLNYVPQMPSERLLEGYKRLLAEIYSPRVYFRRCRTLLARLPRRPRVPGGLRPGDMAAFFRSLWRQGFSSYGLRYLGLLLWTALTRPARFPMAVTLSVRGHHYFRITREILEAHAFTSAVRELTEALRAEAARLAAAPIARPVQALEAYLGEVLRPVRRTYRRLSAEARLLVGDGLEQFERRCLGALASVSAAGFKP
jgi:radical SAM superfamily enzyme YgiQ (UPF0313 family)